MFVTKPIIFPATGTLTLHKTVGSPRLMQAERLQNKNHKKVVENLGLVGEPAGLDQSEPAREK